MRYRSIVVPGLLLFAVSGWGEVRHPLDALQADEIAAVRELLVTSDAADESTQFASVSLVEPPKDEVLAWKPDDPIPRLALARMLREGQVFEARVDLAAGTIREVRTVEGAQSSILMGEGALAQEIVTNDPGWRAAMAKRGYRRITEDRIMCAPLSAGYFAEPEFAGRRIVRVQCLDLQGTKQHIYQRPIEGLTAVVDLVEERVVKLVDEGVVPVPEPSGNYDEASLKPYKPAMNAIAVSQPDGPSYAYDGSFVEWGPWRFHLRMDRRRGIIVSLASFENRSVLYQASLSEMWVPYMDPSYGWFFKSYFDAGEYGFGLFATPLAAGIDCPEHATFYDQTMALDDGLGAPYPKVLCLFERPTMNPAWRHYELSMQTFGGRPGRELVARMISAIGNYDYVFDFIFQPTGAITVSIASTGIDITKAVAAATLEAESAAADTRHGNLIAPNLVGVFHDHFFSLRFDLDVDGPVNNFVRDRIVQRAVGGEGPRTSLWTVESERVRSEAAAQLDIDMRAPEQWRVESAERRNAMGYPTGYALLPAANALPQLALDDYPMRRAGFARHHLWVTPYDPAELFSAGDYPNQSRGGDGLPEWTAANRSISGTDVVLWYTLGFHHVTAAEDWPVLPSHPKTVTLRPFNFFDRSQVINLAPAQAR